MECERRRRQCITAITIIIAIMTIARGGVRIAPSDVHSYFVILGLALFSFGLFLLLLYSFIRTSTIDSRDPLAFPVSASEPRLNSAHPSLVTVGRLVIVHDI